MQPGTVPPALGACDRHGDDLTDADLGGHGTPPSVLVCSSAMCYVSQSADVTLHGPFARIVEGAVAPMLMQVRPLARGSRRQPCWWC